MPIELESVLSGANVTASLDGNPITKALSAHYGDRARKLNKVVTAHELGMKFDGVTDDTAAWQAIPSKVESGTTVTLPVGKTILTGGMTYTDKSIHFIGSGPGTEIYFRPTGFAVLVNATLTDVLYTFEFRNCSLYSQNPQSYGIAVTRPDANSNIFYGPIISGNIFRGEDPNLDTWGTCIQLVNCYNFKVHCNHATGNPSFSMNFLVVDKHATDGTVFDNRIAVGNYGVRALDGSISEGMQIAFNKFVGVRVGVDLGYGVNSPGAQIISNHINADEIGIRCVTRPQLSIYGNLIYRFREMDFTGIIITAACNSSIIQGNTVVGFKDRPGISNGMVFSGTDDFMIVDNILDNCKVGLDGTDSSAGLDDRNIFLKCTQSRNSFNKPGHVAGTVINR